MKWTLDLWRFGLQVPTPVQASDRSPAIIGFSNELNTESRWECSVFHRSMEKPRFKSDIHDTWRRCRLHCFLQHQRFHQECYRVRSCRTFLDLDERAVCMERERGDRTITQYIRVPRTESKKTRIKKNTATDQVNTLVSTTIAQRPTTADNRQEKDVERRLQQATQQAKPRSKTAPLSVIYGPKLSPIPIGVLRLKKKHFHIEELDRGASLLSKLIGFRIRNNFYHFRESNWFGLNWPPKSWKVLNPAVIEEDYSEATGIQIMNIPSRSLPGSSLLGIRAISSQLNSRQAWNSLI